MMVMVLDVDYRGSAIDCLDKRIDGVGLCGVGVRKELGRSSVVGRRDWHRSRGRQPWDDCLHNDVSTRRGKRGVMMPSIALVPSIAPARTCTIVPTSMIVKVLAMALVLAITRTGRGRDRKSVV